MRMNTALDSLSQGVLKTSHSNLTLEERVRRFEREEIKAEIALHGEDVEGKRAAAKALGISLASLYNKLKET